VKKLLSIIIALSLFAVPASAQLMKVDTLATPSYGLTLDTVVNAGTKSTSAYTPAEWKNGITVQVVVTKNSGTVGGTLALQGSMNGTNWTTIGSAATPSDGSATYSFNTTVAWKRYRTTWTGTGSMNASFKTYVMPY